MRFVIVLLLGLAPILSADVPMQLGRSASQPREFGTPPLRDSRSAAAEVVSVNAVDSFELKRLRALNEADGRLRNGVVRELDAPLLVETPRVATASSGWKWRGRVRVEGAHGVRLQLTDLRLPEGTTLWVYADDGTAIGFDASLASDGSLWTPTVYSDAITLETSAPDAASFRIAAVADIRADQEIIANGTECFRDAACHLTGSVENSATAIASYSFISGGSSYVCSGGLIIDSASTFTPNFLTANHCVSTPSEAASVETYWDYRAASCNAAPPSRSSRPRTNGAQLLVTSAATDVTLLRLPSVPGQRYWLGWSATPVPSGTALHRISNPGGGPAVYSTSVAETTQASCNGAPRPRFIYQTQTLGGTAGGSSGSPVLRGEGVIVGQLTGGCGPDTDNPCNFANRDFDGALAESFALLKPYIDPGTSAPCAACTSNATTACLLDNRFKMTVSWSDAFIQARGSGKPVRFTENKPERSAEHGAIIDTAFFAFFDFFPNTAEMMVKMTKAVGINDKYWIYMAGLTTAEYTVTIQDTRTCQTWQRTQPAGSTAVIRDQAAFPFP